MERVTYEVRVAGVVSQEDLDDMAAVRLAEGSTSTVLCGVPDQSALHGLLDRFMALGIEVVEVRRIPTTWVADDRGSGRATR
ncbi:hypothetical protein RKE38_10705 [Phycicoccus sp. M110.8]|uniref:hypothetical protein n=1 Tax=Phycicoccus sp. M110.8 TaxID=3075433 RepID=UPI0028FDA2F1|nr:hypothetical protein [Phycicoccus sp. M110.8]MDU0314155.1 hypothetical protein [Phycicoccus sp. M110.8]